MSLIFIFTLYYVLDIMFDLIRLCQSLFIKKNKIKCNYAKIKYVSIKYFCRLYNTNTKLSPA
jgi:hypothetical protein